MRLGTVIVGAVVVEAVELTFFAAATLLLALGILVMLTACKVKTYFASDRVLAIL